MTYVPPVAWQRAIKRAIKANLKATRLADGSFRVPSASGSEDHVVTLDEKGQISNCSNCIGWFRGQRNVPCRHAGAVAVALIHLNGHTLEEKA